MPLIVQDTIHILYRFFTNYRILNKCTYSSARSRSRSSTLWHGDKSGGNFGLFGMRFLIDRNEHRVELTPAVGKLARQVAFYAIIRTNETLCKTLLCMAAALAEHKAIVFRVCHWFTPKRMVEYRVSYSVIALREEALSNAWSGRRVLPNPFWNVFH